MSKSKLLFDFAKNIGKGYVKERGYVGIVEDVFKLGSAASSLGKKIMSKSDDLSEDAMMEYIQEFERCNADGRITASERRLLNRLAKSLGIDPTTQRILEGH